MVIFKNIFNDVGIDLIVMNIVLFGVVGEILMGWSSVFCVMVW